jgi:hypothetical protein
MSSHNGRSSLGPGNKTRYPTRVRVLCGPFGDSGVAFWQFFAAHPGFHTFTLYPTRVRVLYTIMVCAGPSKNPALPPGNSSLLILGSTLSVIRPKASRQVRFLGHTSCGAQSLTTGTTSGHCVLWGTSHASGTTSGCVLRGTRPRFRYDFGLYVLRGYDTPGYDLGFRLLALRRELVTTEHEV